MTRMRYDVIAFVIASLTAATQHFLLALLITQWKRNRVVKFEQTLSVGASILEISIRVLA